MKKLVALILAVLCVLGLTACGTNNKFVTGGESGTYYAFGSVIASHAKSNAGVDITAVVGNGSKSNVQELEDGTAKYAFCQSDVMAYAYAGTNIFEQEGAIKSFSTVAALYTEQVQIVTCDPNITSVADLRDKKVSIGSAGSGVFFNAVDILGAYGMTLDDIHVHNQSFEDSANSLQNGQIDAAFIVAGAPTNAVVSLKTANANTHLVSLDQTHINTLLQSSPYYTSCTIGNDVYGCGEATTVGVGAVILARDDAEDDQVYAFVKDIFDNASSLVATHAKYGELSLDYATSITSVPYHAGAARYFAEKGRTVATKTK